MKDIERRIVKSPGGFKIERRKDGTDGSKTTITGYAAVFGSDSVDLGGWTEEIAPGAFSTAIRKDDIRALVDHDPGRILGRNKSGTLKLKEDKRGLRMKIDVPDTQTGRDIVESIDRGDVDGASFSFRTIEDEWNTKDGMPHRTLIKVRLFDTGPVSFPAYPDTVVAVRSLEAFKKESLPVEPVAEPVADPLEDLDRIQKHSESL